jgi:hypothetical protein
VQMPNPSRSFGFKSLDLKQPRASGLLNVPAAMASNYIYFIQIYNLALAYLLVCTRQLEEGKGDSRLDYIATWNALDVIKTSVSRAFSSTFFSMGIRTQSSFVSTVSDLDFF